LSEKPDGSTLAPKPDAIGECRLKEESERGRKHRFDGMPALITGGASGIGLAVASRIIAEGGQLTLWDDAAQAKFGPKARAKHVDITKPEEVGRAAKDAEAATGHIDILVCSAGVAGLNADVVDCPINEWKRVFDANINGLF
jgi:3-oxoacyl-[acyl-carrier protein] reductase